MAKMAAQASKISMAPTDTHPLDPTWLQMVTQKLGILVTSRENSGHGHKHRHKHAVGPWTQMWPSAAFWVWMSPWPLVTMQASQIGLTTVARWTLDSNMTTTWPQVAGVPDLVHPHGL